MSIGAFDRWSEIRKYIRVDEVTHPDPRAHEVYERSYAVFRETYEKLKDRIRHVHLKNSVSTSDGVRYSLMSQGDVPVVEVLKLLASGGYDGWIAFEWEKRWHPEIEEPEVALPDFIRVLRAAEAELARRHERT